VLRDDLLDLTKAEAATAHFSEAVIPSKKDLNKRLQFQPSESQLFALRACLKKEGITCIRGGYSSGKTSLLASVAHSLLMITP